MVRQYREYLEHVLEYLTSFVERTQPLQDLDRLFAKVGTEFEQLWADGKVLGWENKDLEAGLIQFQEAVIDLDYYSSVEELMEVGPQKLREVNSTSWPPNHQYLELGFVFVVEQKANPLNTWIHLALAAQGLKTGGTLQQRAERLFLTKVIEQTKENVEKKQALTYEEMEAEREEEVIQADTESDDEEQQIYNPLKLPMGWDGKPIPYWLYKLHGLGQDHGRRSTIPWPPLMEFGTT
ncbi:hypothetical protein GW17_00041688 [Ensete ventricosum]|nr:hypothetical protein GW17_00041688 [Ensete ventricosum]